MHSVETEFDVFERREFELESAARSIVALCRNDQFGQGWRPKGIDEVAILLESLGYSTEVVQQLWYGDLFELAKDVSAYIDRYVEDEEIARAAPSPDWFTRVCRDYAVGALYSGPWIIAVAGVLVFGAALWSSIAMPVHLATAIALGILSSQVVAGFFSQAIARRLTFYVLQENAILMEWMLARFIFVAFASIVTVAVVLWFGLRGMYGDPDAWLAASFFVGSALFQISLAPLYTMRKFGRILLIALGATLISAGTFVLGFHRHVDVPWEPATIAFEIGVIGLGVLFATQVSLFRMARSVRGTVLAPSRASIARASLPYSLFGALYFCAILVDRVFAGLAGSHHGYVYPARYEIAADIALLVMLPVTGFINVVLEELPRRILGGAGTLLNDREKFDRAMLRFYARGVLGSIAAVAVSLGAVELVGARAVALAHAGSAAPAVLHMLRIAAAAYGLVMLGLLNVQVLFFLSRPAPALAGAATAAAINTVLCAAMLSEHAPPERMVWGLFAGVVCFCAITAFGALDAMRRFTFVYYAAY